MEELQPKPSPFFTNHQLITLVIPLVIERFLDMAVGMADTIMVATVGEAAVSGIALVDTINNLIIFVLSALATGGAVVVSQYLGKEDKRNARMAAKQLIYATTFVALALTLCALLWRDGILHGLFGEPEPAVMQSAQTYFFISALSFPFIALFNSAAAIFRSMGNSRTSMIASLIMNLVNIGGNAILIYGYHMGVAGAAIATLASRVAASIMMLILLRNPHNRVFVAHLLRIKLQWGMIKNILKVGIPNGIENGMFHIGKLMVQSLITTFGTAAIAANTIAGRVMALAHVPGGAIQLAIITVVGYCIGAGDYTQADYYAKKLMKWVYLITGTLAAICFFVAGPAVALFGLSEEATELGTRILKISVPFIIVIWPLSFPFANVIRAAGDAKYTMVVSIVSMCVVRVGLSYLLAYAFDMGFLGVWYAMFADWFVRALFFVLRFRSGKWKHKQII